MAQVAHSIRDHRPQEPVNSGWQAATSAHLSLPALEVISAQAQEELQRLVSQDSSNLAWSPATARQLDKSLTQVPGDASVSRLEELTPQHLSNAAQAPGTSRAQHRPTTAGTAQFALRASGFRPDGLATLTWSSARLGHHHPLLFKAAGARAGQLLQARRSTWANLETRPQRTLTGWQSAYPSTLQWSSRLVPSQGESA